MEIKKNKSENFGLGIGLCYGALGGFIVGLIIRNILIGSTLGAAIGVIIGNIYDEIIDLRIYKINSKKKQIIESCIYSKLTKSEESKWKKIKLTVSETIIRNLQK